MNYTSWLSWAYSSDATVQHYKINNCSQQNQQSKEKRSHDHIN